MNGVQEVYIYCGAHTDQVEDYINRSKRWASNSRTNPFTVLQFVRVSDARSLGDFLRDLDKRSIVDGDFILVHGDVVANISLDQALAAHRARREAAGTNIMTMVLRSGGLEDHRTKSKGITPIFVVDTKTKRCLSYDEASPIQSDHYLTLDPAVADELSTEFEIRADLIDPGIDICTPEVLALWSESFDYELPRRNFLHGVLKDWELNGKAIYAEIIDEGYAARANNLQMYDSVSKDILSRWTFPFVPEANLVPGQTYKNELDGICTEDNVVIGSGSQVTGSVVGEGTVIGAGSKVVNTIIGRRCTIGPNVTIQDSYIWDDATIGENTRVSRSIVASYAVVGNNCWVPTASLVSFGVCIGDNTTIPAASTLTIKAHDGSSVPTDSTLVGPSGKGAAYVDPDADEIDEEDPSTLQKSLIYSLSHLNISQSSISTLASERDDDSDDDDAMDAGSTSNAFSSRSRLSSFASDDSSTMGSGSFHTDAVNGLVDALRAESGDFDSAKLEFMGLRLATNASDSAMRRAVCVAFAKRAAELLSPEYGGLEPTKAADKALNARPGASKFVSEVGVGGGEKEQVEFALTLQKALLKVGLENPRAGILLAAMLQQLYNLDVLEEEGILAWWEDDRASEGSSMSEVKDKCRILVEWLQNAEEEDDDSDESDDE
jgi:translation initiation factor eIF-2B subunit epsilon